MRLLARCFAALGIILAGLLPAYALTPSVRTVILGNTCQSIGFSLAAGNLLSQPNFASGWTTLRATLTPNTIISPNCTKTAASIIEDSTAANTHLTVAASSTGLAASSYTVSVFIHAVPGVPRRLAIQAEDTVAFTNAAFGTCNPGTGVASGAGVTGLWTSPTVSMTRYPNGWWRCSLTFTATVVASAEVIFFLDDGSGVTYSGNGTSGMYLWQADWR